MLAAVIGDAGTLLEWLEPDQPSFPKIISGRIDGAVQPVSEWRQWHQS